MEEKYNPGILKGSMSYTKAIDSVLKNRLKKFNSVERTSKTVQNKLLDAILPLCWKNTVSEIFISLFVVDCLPLQADETTDCSCKT